MSVISERGVSRPWPATGDAVAVQAGREDCKCELRQANLCYDTENVYVSGDELQVAEYASIKRSRQDISLEVFDPIVTGMRCRTND